MKAALCEWLGYLFCEFSFRWFDMFDVPLSDDPWDESEFNLFHRFTYAVGSRAYNVGCYFYNY